MDFAGWAFDQKVHFRLRVFRARTSIERGENSRGLEDPSTLTFPLFLSLPVALAWNLLPGYFPSLLSFPVYPLSQECQNIAGWESIRATIYIDDVSSSLANGAAAIVAAFPYKINTLRDEWFKPFHNCLKTSLSPSTSFKQSSWGNFSWHTRDLQLS